jgi:hypothetical protein
LRFRQFLCRLSSISLASAPAAMMRPDHQDADESAIAPDAIDDAELLALAKTAGLQLDGDVLREAIRTFAWAVASRVAGTSRTIVRKLDE